MNFKQIKAIEQNNKERILKACPKINEESGIYVLTREENDFKYAYVGQAKHLLTRLASHLSGYQHIDLSLKKHGFYSETNQSGWRVNITEFDRNELDSAEQQMIKIYANKGYQMRNKTAGGQGDGKFEIAETKPRKGYYDGLEQGRLKTIAEISKLYKQQTEIKKDGSLTVRAIKANEQIIEILKGKKYE